MNKKFSLLQPIIATFVGLLIVANIIAAKFWDISLLGFNISMDMGTLLLFPMLYIFSDILVQVYGYHVARRVTWYGFGMQIIAAILFSAAVAMPYSQYYTNQEAFKTVLGVVPPLVLASLLGYWSGSFTNNYIISKMKQWMVKWDPNHKFLPLRTISSTFVGQLVDTTVFVGVGTLFKVFPIELLLSLIISQWLIKTLIEVVMTPVTVYVVNWVKTHQQIDIVGTNTYNPFKVNSSGGKNLKEV